MNELTQEAILKGNITIFEFMSRVHPNREDLDKWKMSKLEYHSSWNELMPVVERIESIYDYHHGYFRVHISSNACSIQGTNLYLSLNNLSGYGGVYMSDPNALFPTKIESAWYNIIQFIEWYNSTTLNNTDNG